MSPRGVLGCCLLASIAVAGCGSRGTDSPPLEIGWLGGASIEDASYTYAASGVNIRVTTEGGIPTKDPSRNVVKTTRLTYEITIQDPRGPRHTEYSEFFDAAGKKVVVTSPCPTFGTAYDTQRPPCQAGKRVTASYMEHGLPGALGASLFWGKTLRAGVPLQVDIDVLGKVEVLHYNVEPRGAECLEVALASSDPPRLDGRRFARLTAIPQTALFCRDLALPQQVHLAGLDLELTSHEASSPGAPGDVAASPWEMQTHPSARPSSDGGPGNDYDPTGFSYREALRFIEQESSEGREFVAKHPEYYVRYTTITARRAADVAGQQAGSETERVIILGAPDGRTFQADLLRTCTLLVCSVSERGAPTEGTIESAFDRRTIVSLPVEETVKTWNAAGLATPTWVELSVGFLDGDLPDYGPPGEFLHWFYLSGTADGVPHTMGVSGRSGAILHFSLPAAIGQTLL